MSETKNTLLIIKKIAKMTNNLKVTIVKFDDRQVTIDDRQVREGKHWLKIRRSSADDRQNLTIITYDLLLLMTFEV